MKYVHKDGKNFDFLIGKSIIKVEEKQVKDEYGYNVDGYILTCKDGTIIEIATNEGCGGCSNGWSSFEDLKKLEENNNIITNIEVKYTEDGWDNDEFTMFIYYEDNTINQLKGSDGYGNGFYGGGFYITIKNVERKGEKVIIPMNMRDGCIIGIGKGNEDWNYSAPHGAGRTMSRNMAKQTLNIEDYKNSMNGIYSTSVNEETIDEAPMVYKPMEEIIEHIKDTVEIEKIIKPIYNFKASK